MQKLIKEKIEQIKIIDKENNKHQQLYRAKFRSLLKEIEDLGGWLVLGYKSSSQFYKEEFGIVTTSASHQNAAKDYEILLGIPLGYYSFNDFGGIKSQFTFGMKQKINEEEIIYKPYCKIQNAQTVKKNWEEICKKANTNLPTPQQIHELSESQIKKVTSTDQYRERSKKLKQFVQEIEQIKKELDLTKLELERERKAKEKVDKQNDENIPFITQQMITALREDRDRLKAENERLKKEIEQLTTN